MPEHVRCNLCGADSPKPLFRLKDYRLRVEDVEWQAVRCTRCGLGYLDPRPTPDEIARYYPEEYYADRGVWGAQRYVRQADYVPGPPGRLLDVGTARGDFLAVMQERGWDVVGIEPFEQAGNPHGLTIHRTWFPDLDPDSLGVFDVVTAWAVFEHLFDPAAAFAACAQLLAPGGSLLVQVPNLRSPHSLLALKEDVPRHLYFFDARTLRAFGERAGLELERVVHTTDLFDANGRGALRLALMCATGRGVDAYFDWSRTPRGERFRRAPLLAAAWTAAAGVERVVLGDAVVRAFRMSGQILAVFRRA